jgi:hypothetical protein
MKRPTLILLGTVLLAGVGADIFMAASYQPVTRSAELENFHLAGPTGRSYSIESFPSGSVLAIYFGYTTCQRSCPIALNSIAVAIDRLGKLGATVQLVLLMWIRSGRRSSASLGIWNLSDRASLVSPFRPTRSSRRPGALRSNLSASNSATTPTDHVMKRTSPIFIMRPNDPHPKPLPASSAPGVIEATLRSML